MSERLRAWLAFFSFRPRCNVIKLRIHTREEGAGGGRDDDESNIQYSIIEMTQLQVAAPSANSTTSTGNGVCKLETRSARCTLRPRKRFTLTDHRVTTVPPDTVIYPVDSPLLTNLKQIRCCRKTKWQ